MYMIVHPTLKRREYEHERACHAEAKGSVSVHPTLKRREHVCERASHAEANVVLLGLIKVVLIASGHLLDCLLSRLDSLFKTTKTTL